MVHVCIKCHATHPNAPGPERRETNAAAKSQFFSDRLRLGCTLLRFSGTDTYVLHSDLTGQWKLFRHLFTTTIHKPRLGKKKLFTFLKHPTVSSNRARIVAEKRDNNYVAE